MIKSGTVLRNCSDVRYRSLGGEGIVVRQRAGEVLVLNEIGVRVLALLEPAMSVDGLIEAVNTEYDVDRATLETDIPAYLQELLDAGVIECVAA